MNKQASVLVIGLWILVILTMLVLNTGHRVTLALRISGYQRDRLKAYALAKAGINQAIAFLEKKKLPYDYDALNEPWASDEIFKRISLSDAENEFATISYRTKEGEREITKFGMRDEEGRLNINNSNRQQLYHLLTLAGLDPETEAKALADLILRWIDKNAESPEEKQIFKNQKLKLTQELLVILEYFYLKKSEQNFALKAQELYNKIKDLITVYGDGKININTASPEALEILIESLAQAQQIPSLVESDAKALVKRIVDFRDGGGIFTKEDSQDIEDKLNSVGLGLSTGQLNLMHSLLANRMVKLSSGYFRIESTGRAGKVNAKITAVYGRNKGKIAYWHIN